MTKKYLATYTDLFLKIAATQLSVGTINRIKNIANSSYNSFRTHWGFEAAIGADSEKKLRQVIINEFKFNPVIEFDVVPILMIIPRNLPLSFKPKETNQSLIQKFSTAVFFSAQIIDKSMKIHPGNGQEPTSNKARLDEIKNMLVNEFIGVLGGHDNTGSGFVQIAFHNLIADSQDIKFTIYKEIKNIQGASNQEFKLSTVHTVILPQTEVNILP